MNNYRLIAIGISLASILACSQAKESGAVSQKQPEDLTFSQVGENSVLFSWKDVSDDETGYWVFLRSEDTGFHVEPVNVNDPLPAGSTSYTFTSLETGKTYSFGVQALGESVTAHSKIAYTEDYTLLTALDAAGSGPSPLAAPSGVSVATEEGAVTVSWEYSGNAESYIVYLRPEDQSAFSTVYGRATASERSCTLKNIPAGTFVAGVQAIASPLGNSSAIGESSPFRMQDAVKLPVINSVSATYAYVMINYTVSIASSKTQQGLCFSAEGLPDLNDTVIWGPTLPLNKTVSQLIPNAVLDQGKDYQVCVYVKVGGNCYYSDPVTVRLEEEPELPSLEWKKVPNPSGIPSEIEVYATETPLNGRPFKAWYAVADCTGDIQLKVLAPESLTTIDKLSEQWNGDCYVLVNGGYFAWDSGWTSPYVKDGVRVGEGYGASRTSDASWTLATPAVLGVDAEGVPAAYWWSARKNKAYYYNLPQPTVPDQAKYWYESSDEELSSFPGEDQKWEPYSAISAGPMVLYDGKVVVDNSHNGDWYTTNYELLASDIFPGYSPDRTAIGFLPDGRMVLFICDGRVDESDGASLPELGLVMKSIGCVAAQNLDGGGSTGMMFGSTHLNTWQQGKGSARKEEYRAVKTAIGFFKKQ